MNARKTPRSDLAISAAVACLYRGGAIKILGQRARSLETETQELAEALRDTVAILEERHTDRPDDIGAKEPAILSAANAALARHRAKQEVQS